MTDNVFLTYNNIDLEVRLCDDNQEPLTFNKISEKSTTNYYMKLFIWIIIMFFAFPLLFCDLYYGYNDTSCVSEPAYPLTINLKDYLLIGGWIYSTILIILTIGLYFIDINSLDNINNTCFICCGGLSIIILAIVNIYSSIWNVLGVVIFFGLMNKSACDEEIYNYVFASLIIKIVFNAIGILKTKNDNK